MACRSFSPANPEVTRNDLQASVYTTHFQQTPTTILTLQNSPPSLLSAPCYKSLGKTNQDVHSNTQLMFVMLICSTAYQLCQSLCKLYNGCSFTNRAEKNLILMYLSAIQDLIRVHVRKTCNPTPVRELKEHF